MYNNFHAKKNHLTANKFFSSFTAAIGLIGWAIVFVILSIINLAKPPEPTIIEKTLNIKQSITVWDYTLLSDAWILIIILLVISALSLIFKLTICKKKFGAVFISLLLLTIYSVISMFVFQMKF